MTTDLAAAPHSTRTGPALVLQAVTKRFGDTVAVDGIDVDLDAHELLALVGPSGCGKSTLLRVIAGLLGADAGQVTLAGRLVDDGRTHLPPERRHIGLVFQDHALFPHLTVSANVAFGLSTMTKPARRARVDEVLEMVGLADFGRRYPHELSGGERQRVALARALAPRPTLLLLDEPFASLDPNLRAQIRTEVERILRATGTPAVFVTHDQGEALALGDRVAVMHAGRIRQLGTPWEVFHQPADRFVAAFMGEADFLDLQHHGTGVTTELGPLDTDNPPSAGAVAMVRPDDVTFEPDAEGQAEIVDIEFRGAVSCYTLRLPSGALVRSTRSHLFSAAVGSRVHAEVAPGHRPQVLSE